MTNTEKKISILRQQTVVNIYQCFFYSSFIPIRRKAKSITLRRGIFMLKGGNLITFQFTVIPVNKGHLKERRSMVFIDKWPLFGG